MDRVSVPSGKSASIRGARCPGCRRVRQFRLTWDSPSAARQHPSKCHERAVGKVPSHFAVFFSWFVLDIISAPEMGRKMRWYRAPRRRSANSGKLMNLLVFVRCLFSQTIRNVFGPLTFPNGGLFRICYSPDGIQWQVRAL